MLNETFSEIFKLREWWNNFQMIDTINFDFGIL